MDLPKIQNADIKGKIVLIRVDHNVVKSGGIKDPFRIDATIGTLFKILAKGGKPILMTHVSRPRNKKTAEISMDEKYSVVPIINYLKRKLHVNFVVPEFPIDSDKGGFPSLDDSILPLIEKLKNGKIDGIYLPNVRWFWGEEAKDEKAEILGKQMASFADVFVNDAFGSWQPHASTVQVTRFLPSYAGLLMQHEIDNLEYLFKPKHPFISVIAGSKFDTKIGPLRALLEKSDHLMMGGVIYNAYLCVKYGIKIAGVSEDDLKSASEFYEFSQKHPSKLIEPQFIIESDTLEGKIENKYRVIDVNELQKGTELKYILDVAPKSFENENMRDIFAEAESIFVNAVMGFTPHFGEGTRSLYKMIAKNKKAYKMFGGGDTLQEFKTLLPGEYLNAIDDSTYYFFTGGGTILKAIQEGSVLGLEPVKMLMKNKKNFR